MATQLLIYVSAIQWSVQLQALLHKLTKVNTTEMKLIAILSSAFSVKFDVITKVLTLHFTLYR